MILHTDYKSSEVWVIPSVLRLVRAALKTRNDHQGCVAWPGLALTRKNNILNSLDNVTAAVTHDTDDNDEECWRKLARLDSDDDSVGAAATDDNVVTNQQDISKSVSGAHNNDDDSPQLIVHTASADNIITVQILSSYQLLISLMKTWTTWKEQSISMSKLNQECWVLKMGKMICCCQRVYIKMKKQTFLLLWFVVVRSWSVSITITLVWRSGFIISVRISLLQQPPLLSFLSETWYSLVFIKYFLQNMNWFHSCLILNKYKSTSSVEQLLEPGN